jgi:hypothetical protein
MVVMPDGLLVPPLPHPLIPLAQLIVQRRKEREVTRRDGAESHPEPPARLRDTARKSLVYVQFV